MIAEKPQYAGQCMLCKQTFNKGQVTRHLKKCVAQHQEEAGKPVKMFHLVIEGNHMPMYWLHVEIPGALTLQHLDAFLRDIWLECCGHLSCFTIEGQRYSVHPAEDVLFGTREKTMGQKLYNVLGPVTKFQHEYDYGSTTELKLRVVEFRERQVKKPDITLLARNEAPAWECAKCGKPATQIQATGWGLDMDSVFCDVCIGDEQEEGYLPLVNSPRTGVCGYCG
jgi:hypothetical protein